VFLVEFFSRINGHFYFDGNYYTLVPPYLCLLAPLIPFDKIKKYSLYIFVTGIIFGWALLSNFSFPESRQMAVLHRDNTSVLVIKNGDNAAIIGNIEDKRHADILGSFIMNTNIRKIVLYIPKPDINSLKSFSYFIKRNVVDRCAVSPEAISNFYFKNFCETVDNDGIKMEVRDFKTSGETVNKDDVYYLYQLMIKGELKRAEIRYPVKYL
jgi:hypothetical protein